MFLDTNALVSAFAARGLCADLFEVVLLEHELIIGDNVLRELTKALKQKVKLPARVADSIVEFGADEATQIIKSSGPVSVQVDRDDAMVLGEAVGGDATAFVTGDTKLLELGHLGELQIVSPRAFWEMLQAGQR